MAVNGFPVGWIPMSSAKSNRRVVLNEPPVDPGRPRSERAELRAIILPAALPLVYKFTITQEHL